jgi:hypothetical protein
VIGERLDSDRNANRQPAAALATAPGPFVKSVKPSSRSSVERVPLAIHARDPTAEIDAQFAEGVAGSPRSAGAPSSFRDGRRSAS